MGDRANFGFVQPNGETIEMYHKFLRQQENKNSKNPLSPEMGYLSSISEGYAEDKESADKIIEGMSETWYKFIVKE